MKFRTAIIKDLATLVRELGVVFKDLSFEDNFTSFQVTDQTIAANTEVKFRNELNVIPGKMVIVKQTGNALVTAGDTAWTTNYVYIKNHDASNSATVTIVFLR